MQRYVERRPIVKKKKLVLFLMNATVFYLILLQVSQNSFRLWDIFQDRAIIQSYGLIVKLLQLSF